jgi:hypothetical protein
MRLIQLTRKDTPAAKAKLLQELEDAYADKENAALLKVLPHPDDDDDETVEAVIIPHHSEFSDLFKTIAKSKGTRKSEFQWNDPELEALLGLGAMQVNFQADANLLLVDAEKKSEVIFAIVTKAFYDSNK